ncbi:MAG: DUF2357 domain-containing protein [Oscillochloris sp.]|nr:DUF2357 domain-containing protein [Oscillochloris sp.]
MGNYTLPESPPMFTLTLGQWPPPDQPWEIEEWRVAEFTCLPPTGATLQLWVGDLELEPFLRPGDPAWRWRLPARGAVGSFGLLLRAEWPDGHAEELRSTLLVRPRKLDAQRYHDLLADLERLGPNLLFALTGGTVPGGWADPADPHRPGPAEELAGLLGPDTDLFLAAAERVMRRPPERLRPGLRLVDPGLARDLSALDRAHLHAAAAPADKADAPTERAHQLDAIPERQSISSYDSYESRLLKRTLALLARRVALLDDTPDLPGPARRRVTHVADRLRSLRAQPILAEVAALSQFAGPSPRMQRAPDYRAIYRMWQLLRRRPQIAWDKATLALPIQDLARLYERWCVAMVSFCLLHIPDLRLVEQSIARHDPEDDTAWTLRLAEGGPLLVLDSPTGTQLRLFYQARYTPHGISLRSLDRHTRVPDLALEISRPNAPPRLALLDAKFRLDPTGGVPEEALSDAYSYLGSIGTSDGERAVSAVALLYPGLGSAEIYPSGVAALPLLPGTLHELSGWLEHVLDEYRTPH